MAYLTECQVHQSIVADTTITSDTTTDGLGFSTKGFTQCLVAVHIGQTFTGTTPTIQVHLESSTLVGSGYADIGSGATQAIMTAITAAPGATDTIAPVGRLSLNGQNAPNEFIRAVAVTTGTTTGIDVCVSLILLNADDSKDATTFDFDV